MSAQNLFRQSMIASATGLLLLLSGTAGHAQDLTLSRKPVQYPTVQPGKNVDVQPGAEAAAVELPINRVINLGVEGGSIRSVSGFDLSVVMLDVNDGQPGRVSLMGQSVGETTLRLTDENDAVTLVTVRVTNEVPQQLLTLIDELFPDADVRLHNVNQAVLIRGTVAKPDDVAKLLEIVQQFYPQVLNQVEVTGGRRMPASGIPPFYISHAQESEPPSYPSEPDPSPMRVPEAPRPPAAPTYPGAGQQDLRDDLKALHADVKRLIELLEARQPKRDLFGAPTGELEIENGVFQTNEGRSLGIEPVATSPRDGGTPSQRRVVWGKLGLRLLPSSFSPAEEFKSPLKGGMRIVAVRQDVPNLANTRIREGDVLYSLGLEKTTSLEDVLNVLNSATPEAEVLECEIVRDGNLVIGELPLLRNRDVFPEQPPDEQSSDENKGVSDGEPQIGEELLYFYAEWCGPCQRISPLIQEVQDQQLVAVREIDVDSERALTQRYGVTSIPELVLLRDGEVVARISRSMSKGRVERFVRKYLDETFTFPVGFVQ